MYQNTVEIVMIIVCELLSTINSKQNPQQYNQCIRPAHTPQSKTGDKVSK